MPMAGAGMDRAMPAGSVKTSLRYAQALPRHFIKADSGQLHATDQKATRHST